MTNERIKAVEELRRCERKEQVAMRELSPLESLSFQARASGTSAPDCVYSAMEHWRGELSRAHAQASQMRHALTKLDAEESKQGVGVN